MNRFWTFGVALLIVLSSACAVDSPAVKDARGEMHRAASHTDASVTEREMKQEEKAWRPGTTPCFDAAFLGSPDAVSAAQVPSPCWKAILEARPNLKTDAEKARELARDLRGQKEGLKTAEEDACAGLGDMDVALSPFYYADDIVEIGELRHNEELSGATATFRAVEGLDKDWMERAVRCHLARAEVICDPNSSTYCPLVLQGVKAQVKAVDMGVVVMLSSPKPETAREILRRLKALKNPTSL